MAPPAFDDDPGLRERIENLPIQQLVPEPSVEALDEAVLPGAARRDISRLRSDSRDPVLHGLGDELRSVVRAKALGNAAQDEQVGEHIDDVDGLEFPINPDRQAFVRELVDDVQHPIFPSLMGAILDEVIRPDMVRPLGAQPQARAVRQPEPAAFGLFGGDFQPLAPPDPLDPLVIDDPARCRSQQLRDLPIAIAAILPSQFDDVGGQPLLVVWPRRNAALRGSMLSEHAADPPLGQPQLGSNMINAGAAARRA